MGVGKSEHSIVPTESGKRSPRDPMEGGWVLEVDIRAFFDTLDHGQLRQMLDQRVRDGVLRRMIDKWLKAGVLEGGGLVHPGLGTPQGGVISPLLANIYLHEVLDTWFETVVRPRMKGSSFLVRYADDFVIAFEMESDARRVMDVLPKRFARFGLTLHPEKTRLVPFRRPSYRSGPKGKGGTQDYASKLDENLASLLERFKSGTYWAPPVRRVHIAKGDGTKTRPIGIPTFEDKVLQRAVTMVLEAVYEQDFLDCSWGFRSGRNAHGAIDTLKEGLSKMRGGWVLDVDIKSFFDTIDHRQLRSFLDQRVRDGVLRRMIDKWLRAGVLEEGAVHHPEEGTPQGGVISPLLASIYLHHVLDTWFEGMAKPWLNRCFEERHFWCAMPTTS